MSFRIIGLPAERFTYLFALSDDELAAQGAVRRTADDRNPGYPCRVSLTDSKPGDDSSWSTTSITPWTCATGCALRFTCARARRRSTRWTKCRSSFASARSLCAQTTPMR